MENSFGCFGYYPPPTLHYFILFKKNIRSLVHKAGNTLHISPHVTRPERVDAVKLRTVFRITVVYYTFCHYNCFSTLRAENFLDNGTEIEVFFPEQRMTPSIEETLPRWFKITLRFARCS